MEPIIQVNQLKKSYKSYVAVKNISFQIAKGEMVALLGPNGAGKSTTIDMLCTFIKPDGGKAIIDGLSLGRQDKEIRKRIGAVFQDGVLDRLLTVEENLYIRGRLYGLKEKNLQEVIVNTAKITGTDKILKKPYGQLSGGQRRRCDIARALLNKPSILFLDEPTTGLDPQMRTLVWETISNIQKQNQTTIILTTHYMEEAAKADNIIIMKEGKIISQGSPNQLKEKFSKDRLFLFSNNASSLIKSLKNNKIYCVVQKEKIEIPLCYTQQALNILKICQGLYTSFEVLKGNMDDAYLTALERG